MIQVLNLSKSYGGKILFDNVNIQINKNEKIGLVGRNGHGKTTLLKIFSNEEEPSNGKVLIPKNYKIGYLKQELIFSKETVLNEGITGLPDNQRNDKWIAEKILFGLGFNKDSIKLNPNQLSGGFQVRLNLAKVLLSNSNILLLDEPTNYLDITSIRWLIKFLKEWKEELILVTHDRSFMDQVITHAMIIHRQKIKKIKGKTEELYSQIAIEEENYEKQRINDEKKRKQLEIFINRFRAKAALSSLVQSRIKQLSKRGKKEKLEKMKIFEFQFNWDELKAHVVMEIKNLNFSYNSLQELIKNISFTVNNKDRIGVIGENGKGKTTLLKLLFGELNPKSGTVVKHNKLKIGYFGQNDKIELHPENTIEEEIMLANPENSFQKVRNICGALLFEEDLALKKINVLSGGEKSRVLLGKILASKVNLLLLDEPTNHLDMEASDALLSAIDNFEGAVVFVTHNEMFLNTIAERFIVFDQGKIFVFEGSYKDFLDKIGWESEKVQNLNNIKGEKINTVSLPFNKESRKERAKIIKEKSEVLRPIEAKYKLLEENIISLEKEFDELNINFSKATEKNNGKIIAMLSKEIHNKKQEIEKLYDELEIIMELYSNKSKEFEIRLNNIDSY